MLVIMVVMMAMAMVMVMMVVIVVVVVVVMCHGRRMDGLRCLFNSIQGPLTSAGAALPMGA